jgi:glycosyltransferase involved in cell wall biosynthesis
VKEKLAIFLATSGHSGVDRVMKNLIREVASRGIPVDLLRTKVHGPRFNNPIPGVREIDFRAKHVHGCLTALIGYLRREKPAALLTDKDRVNRTALIARRWSGVSTRLVVRIGTTVTANLEKRSAIEKRIQAFSMKRLYRWADGVILPSRSAADDFLNYTGIPESHVHVVPSPVIDERFFRLIEEPVSHSWFQPGAPPMVLEIGELSDRKDAATLVRAFAAVREQRNCRLMLLGEGKERGRLESLVTDVGVSGDVVMPGFVENPYPYLKKAAVFVLSSKYEGAPVVLMEALGAHKSIVATDCPGGSREILENGALGSLVPVGDAPAMAKEILFQMDHPVDAARMSAAAMRYEAGFCADRYLEVLGMKNRAQDS